MDTKTLLAYADGVLRSANAVIEEKNARATAEARRREREREMAERAAERKYNAKCERERAKRARMRAREEREMSEYWDNESARIEERRFWRDIADNY